MPAHRSRAAVVTLLLAALLGCHHGPTPPAGNVAASLTLPDLDGHPFDPATLRGKRVLVAFWRPTCPHCVAELPEIEAAITAVPGAVAIAVLVSGNHEQAAATALRQGFTGQILVDTDRALARRYGIDAVPYLLVLDRDGSAVRVLIGEHDRNLLIDSLIVN
jgi:peroxiredoxin